MVSNDEVQSRVKYNGLSSDHGRESEGNHAGWYPPQRCCHDPKKFQNEAQGVGNDADCRDDEAPEIQAAALFERGEDDDEQLRVIQSAKRISISKIQSNYLDDIIKRNGQEACHGHEDRHADGGSAGDTVARHNAREDVESCGRIRLWKKDDAVDR